MMVQPGATGDTKPAGGMDASNEVEVRLPADAVQLQVLRSVTASVASHEDFDIDQVADLRMAVDELGSQLMHLACAGSALSCRLRMLGDRLEVTASVPCSTNAVVEKESFGWYVLQTLSDSLCGWSAPDEHGPGTRLHIALTKERCQRATTGG